MESESDPPKRNKINHHRMGEFPSSSSSASHHDSDSPLMPDLPNELVIHMLSRLPAKSLGKFKCVSKPWLSLISSQEFIKTHLTIASGRDDYGHHNLIVTVFRGPRCRSNEVHSVSSLLKAPTSEACAHKVFDIGYRGSPNKLFWPVGSCNGLVCFITLHNKLFLYNPCVKLYKRLPDKGKENDHYEGNFGFGYDKVNDDYKVVWLYQILNKSSPGMLDDGLVTYDNRIKVYSLKNDAWREIEYLQMADSNWSEFLQYAGGKLYWLVNGRTYGYKIARFDLGNDTYEEMETPLVELPNDLDDRYCTLGDIGGCLSVFCDYGRTHADVWVMKDSWVKIVSIPYVDHPRDVYYCRSRLVCALRSGEMLFVSCSVLILYNPKTNTFRKYPHIGPAGDVIIYVESLVSPYMI